MHGASMKLEFGGDSLVRAVAAGEQLHDQAARLRVQRRPLFGERGVDECDRAAVGVRVGRNDRTGQIVVAVDDRSEEHTSELQSLMRISYAVFCLKKTNKENTKHIQW